MSFKISMIVIKNLMYLWKKHDKSRFWVIYVSVQILEILVSFEDFFLLLFDVWIFLIQPQIKRLPANLLHIWWQTWTPSL